MSEAEKTIRLTIDLTYEPETMHGDDPEAIEWFQELLSGDNLQLGEFFDLGDMIGAVKVVDCDPMQDERVRALEAENARLRDALTPSGDTKAAYICEFSMPFPIIDEHGDEVMLRPNIPWTTIKEIMAAIRARAALRALEQG